MIQIYRARTNYTDTKLFSEPQIKNKKQINDHHKES